MRDVPDGLFARSARFVALHDRSEDLLVSRGDRLETCVLTARKRLRSSSPPVEQGG